MAITGVEYFSGGLFSSSTGTAARYFSDGFFIEDISPNPGVVAVFVDGLIATAATDFTAENIFTFGAFRGVAGAGEGAELIWSHILYQKKKVGQFVPI